MTDDVIGLGCWLACAEHHWPGAESGSLAHDGRGSNRGNDPGAAASTPPEPFSLHRGEQCLALFRPALETALRALLWNHEQAGAAIDSEIKAFADELLAIVHDDPEANWHELVETGSPLTQFDSAACPRTWPKQVLRLALRSADLRRADLSKRDDVPEGLLQGLALGGADLTEANLRGAILSDAYLNEAILAGANLEDADLSRSHMQCTNLRGASLKRAILKSACMARADLSGAELEEAQLKGAMLSDATLNSATLKNTNLECVRADNLVAREAKFFSTNLNCAHLVGADLSGALLPGTTLRRANCQDANFSEVNFIDAELVGADLTGANLTRARFWETSFAGATLYRADLSHLMLISADFTDAKFRDTTVSLRADLLHWITDVDFLYGFFRLELLGGGVLFAIDTISPDHADVKIRLMEQIVVALGALPSIADVAPALAPKLAAVLLRKRVYAQSATIREFMPRLLKAMLPVWNARFIRVDEIDRELVLRCLVDVDPDHKTAAPCQGGMNQLLCVPPQANAGLLELAALARATYLGSPTLEPMASALREIDAELCASSYVFVHKDGLRAVVCDPALFEWLCFPPPANPDGSEPAALPWERIWSFARSGPEQRFENQVNPDTETLLGDYPLLCNAYRADRERQQVARVVTVSVAGAHDYASRFRAALRARVLGPGAKLLSWDHAQALHAQLSRFWVEADEAAGQRGRQAPMLRPEHERKLWLAYESMMDVPAPELPEVPQTPQTPQAAPGTPASRARLLLVMAAIYTYLSSSASFGTERDSPPSLRCHAQALLNRAVVLDPDLLDEASAANWQSRLSGTGGEFSCASALSDIMEEYLRARAAGDEVLARMYARLYPLAWR
jgi:uncharacterized protein YjbI with pentapeptide repeats